MAEAIVSVVLDQLLKVTGGQMQQEVKLVVGVDDEVRNLTSNFEIIQDVIADAEQKQVTEAAVRKWLEKLKDVSYDMDDVLDGWNTAILRSLQPDGAESVHTPERKFIRKGKKTSGKTSRTSLISKLDGDTARKVTCHC